MYNSIPAELRALPHWVGCATAPGEGQKVKKVPRMVYQPKLPASTTRAAEWGSFEEACQAIGYFDVVGVGLVLTANDPYAVIDLDCCRDPATGEIKPWAADIVSRLHSYTEVSMSGAGLHIFVRGKLEGRGRKKNIGNGAGIEVYDRKRFIAVTGDRVPGTPEGIEDRAEVLTAWMEETFPPVRNSTATYLKAQVKCGPRPRFSPQRTDDEVIQTASKATNGAAFRTLFFDGDLNPFDGDHSRADWELCLRLAYWTEDDADQMDRIFRRSALFRPEKWDSPRGEGTYGSLTISRAIAQ